MWSDKLVDTYSRSEKKQVAEMVYYNTIFFQTLVFN